MKTRPVLTAITAAAAGAAIVAFPVAASAAPHPHAVRASTLLTNRGDSGGNGDWALDRMDRTLTITQTGPHTFTAAVRDTGSFTTIRGAFTPNQGGTDAGKHIRGRVSGQVNGAASYSFTATTEPSARLVPSRENGDPATTAESTSDWFEQAFPAGTVFGGAGIGNWNWAYAGKVTVTKYRSVTVYRHGHKVHVIVPYRATRTQRWDDGISNNGGQTTAAGNITG